jgi:hypothetical protein
MAEMVEEHAQKMIKWQKEHCCKLPDLDIMDDAHYIHQGAY